MASSNQRLNATVTIGGALSQSFRGAISSSRKQIASVGDAIKQLKTREARLSKVADHWDKMGRDADAYRKEIERVNTQIGKLRRNQEKLGSIRKAQQANIGRRSEMRGQLFDAVAIGAAASAPIAAAVHFESVMADLNKVANLTPKRLAEVRQQILGMSREMPVAADQIGAIMTAAAQSNIAEKDLTSFTRTAVKMGVAFDIAGGQAGDMMAKWRTGMKLTQPQATALADVTNYLSNKMAATAPEIADVVTRIGAYAKTAGIGEKQTAALAAAMIAAGGAPEKVATGIKRMASNLTAGSSATTKQSEAMKTLGFDASDMAQRMQDDAAGTIELVLKRIKQLDKAKQPAVIKELFGQESVGVIAPLLSNLDSVQKAFQMSGDKAKYAGSMQREYDQRAKTTANNLHLLKNKVVAVGVTLGTVFLPTLNVVASGLGSVADTVADMANKFPVATKVIVGATVALAAMKIAAIAGGYGFTFLKGGVLAGMKTLEKMRSALLLTGRATKVATIGMRALTVATVTNPIGAVVAAIAVGGLLIYKYWKPIKAFFSGLWSGLQSAAGPVGQAMDSVFTALGPVGDAMKLVGHGIKAVIGWFGSLFAPVDSTDKQLQSFQSTGERVGKAIGDAFATMAQGVAQAVKWVMDKIHAVGAAFDKVKSLGGAAVSKVGSAASTVGSWFGLGGGEDKPPAVGQANGRRPTYNGQGEGANGPAPAGRSSQVNSNNTTTNQITIHQQPGEDSHALASRTADEIEKRQRERGRSALYDQGPAYGH
ncbi:MAG: phage tail tape measure protein [Salinisphaera sp.]|jgi:TP901 family phage tail tape measure protein|nr:phage tail tape measure protein [Salinisphaera sp.]